MTSDSTVIRSQIRVAVENLCSCYDQWLYSYRVASPCSCNTWVAVTSDWCTADRCRGISECGPCAIHDLESRYIRSGKSGQKEVNLGMLGVHYIQNTDDAEYWHNMGKGGRSLPFGQKLQAVPNILCGREVTDEIFPLWIWTDNQLNEHVSVQNSSPSLSGHSQQRPPSLSNKATNLFRYYHEWVYFSPPKKKATFVMWWQFSDKYSDLIREGLLYITGFSSLFGLVYWNLKPD